MNSPLLNLAWFLSGISFCLIVEFTIPFVKSAVLAYRVRRAGRLHGRGPWQTKSSAERARDKEEEFERYAAAITKSHDAAMWWFRMGAIFWHRYEKFWVAQFVSDEFATWEQAIYAYDRRGWNNVLEMNRWQIAISFKEMAPRIDQDDYASAEFINPILRGMKQAMEERKGGE